VTASGHRYSWQAAKRLYGEGDGDRQVTVVVIVILEAPGLDGEGFAFVGELVADVGDGQETFAFCEGEGFSSGRFVLEGDEHLDSWWPLEGIGELSCWTQIVCRGL
jgi:hypothetical protein